MECAEGRIEKRTAQEEASWRERALNAEDEIRNLGREVATRRQFVGDLSDSCESRMAPGSNTIGTDYARRTRLSPRAESGSATIRRTSTETRRRTGKHLARLRASRAGAVPRRAGKGAVARPVWNDGSIGPSFASKRASWRVVDLAVRQRPLGLRPAPARARRVIRDDNSRTNVELSLRR